MCHATKGYFRISLEAEQWVAADYITTGISKYHGPKLSSGSFIKGRGCAVT